MKYQFRADSETKDPTCDRIDKDFGLKELRFLVSHLGPGDISDDDLGQMLTLVRRGSSRDIDPVFQTGNFRCWLDRYVLKNYFRVEISILIQRIRSPPKRNLGKL